VYRWRRHKTGLPNAHGESVSVAVGDRQVEDSRADSTQTADNVRLEPQGTKTAGGTAFIGEPLRLRVSTLLPEEVVHNVLLVLLQLPYIEVFANTIMEIETFVSIIGKNIHSNVEIPIPLSFIPR